MQKVLDVLGNPAMWNLLIFVIVPVIIVIANRYIKSKTWEEIKDFVSDVVRQIEQMKKLGIITGSVEDMRKKTVHEAVVILNQQFPITKQYTDKIKTYIDSAVKDMNDAVKKK